MAADNFADLANKVNRSTDHKRHYQSTSSSAAKHDWRLPTEPAADSLNLSDLLENESILSSLATPTPKRKTTAAMRNQLFQPSEITGRSTECIQFGHSSQDTARFSTPPSSMRSSTTVEQILAESFSSEVRSLAPELEQLRISYGGARFTADMGNSFDQFDWGGGGGGGGESDVDAVNATTNPPNSIVDEISFNANNVSEMLKADQQEWDEEYATIPNVVDSMRSTMMTTTTSTGGATYNVDAKKPSQNVSNG